MSTCCSAWVCLLMPGSSGLCASDNILTATAKFIAATAACRHGNVVTILLHLQKVGRPKRVAKATLRGALGNMFCGVAVYQAIWQWICHQQVTLASLLLGEPDELSQGQMFLMVTERCSQKHLFYFARMARWLNESHQRSDVNPGMMVQVLQGLHNVLV